MRRPARGCRARVALRVAAALLVSCVAASRAGAALPSSKDLQGLVEHRQQVTVKLLKIDPQRQAAFEAVYSEYEAERTALGKERNGFADDFSKATLAMTDEQANALTDRFLRLRRQRIELDERFRPRFDAVISPQKTLLLFQLNFILDAVVNYDLAGMIPLVQ